MTNVKPSMLDLSSYTVAELCELGRALTAEIIARRSQSQGRTRKRAESLGPLVSYPPVTLMPNLSPKVFLPRREKYFTHRGPYITHRGPFC